MPSDFSEIFLAGEFFPLNDFFANTLETQITAPVQDATATINNQPVTVATTQATFETSTIEPLSTVSALPPLTVATPQPANEISTIEPLSTFTALPSVTDGGSRPAELVQQVVGQIDDFVEVAASETGINNFIIVAGISVFTLAVLTSILR